MIEIFEFGICLEVITYAVLSNIELEEELIVYNLKDLEELNAVLKGNELIVHRLQSPDRSFSKSCHELQNAKILGWGAPSPAPKNPTMHQPDGDLHEMICDMALSKLFTNAQMADAASCGIDLRKDHARTSVSLGTTKAPSNSVRRARLITSMLNALGEYLLEKSEIWPYRLPKAN